ncbi:MAG: tyrosine--tRNA ligase [Actinomycetota bacterium]
MSSGIFSDLEWRGLVHQQTDPGLGDVLAGRAVTCYCGFDPTAPSLTTAHLLQLLTLRRIQNAGHRPIALAGGATGLIGDPSGRDSERSLLSREEIEFNVVKIKTQLETLLDFTPGESRAVLANNADWFAEIGLLDFLREVGRQFSVGMMISKESVRARLEEREQGISYAEFSYMLLQSYDFLHLFDTFGCRMQIGGSDQWGNITAGIELIRRSRGEAAFGLTTPLLLTPEGRKMSKSEGTAVWLDPELTSPYRYYQFWFNTDDRQVIQFLKFFTFLGPEEVGRLEVELGANPGGREAQKVLAREMTDLIHGNEETRKAVKASESLFGDLSELDERTLLEVFEDAPSSRHSPAEAAGGLNLVDLLVQTGLAGSRSEARSHISSGGVYVNNRRATGTETGGPDLLAGKYIVLRRGKKTHHLLRFE